MPYMSSLVKMFMELVLNAMERKRKELLKEHKVSTEFNKKNSKHDIFVGRIR